MDAILIAGLGNAPQCYAASRHNAGAQCIRYVAQGLGATFNNLRNPHPQFRHLGIDCEENELSAEPLVTASLSAAFVARTDLTVKVVPAIRRIGINEYAKKVAQSKDLNYSDVQREMHRNLILPKIAAPIVFYQPDCLMNLSGPPVYKALTECARLHRTEDLSKPKIKEDLLPLYSGRGWSEEVDLPMSARLMVAYDDINVCMGDATTTFLATSAHGHNGIRSVDSTFRSHRKRLFGNSWGEEVDSTVRYALDNGVESKLRKMDRESRKLVVPRLKVGLGDVYPKGSSMADFVLQDFTQPERTIMQESTFTEARRSILQFVQHAVNVAFVNNPQRFLIDRRLYPQFDPLNRSSRTSESPTD